MMGGGWRRDIRVLSKERLDHPILGFVKGLVIDLPSPHNIRYY